jgi:glycolate oxidase FAD binding subunit
MPDVIERWQERIRDAAANGGKLRPKGGGSKDFYGGRLDGEVLDTREWRGVVAYEPTELVITARSGTSLSEVEATLAEHGQMLAFEPPRFGGNANAATLGGVVAAGLAGPRRQLAGSVRDFVLGVRLLDGHGDLLHFGGEVMKNVAGYDVARLMAGSLGTLGVLVEVSLKVLPRPRAETTLVFSASAAQAVDWLNAWSGQPLPLSGSCWVDDVLSVRLSGAPAAVEAAVTKLGGEGRDEAAAFWLSLRDQTHAFFADRTPLWRLALPSACPPLRLPGAQAIEWGGSQRWLKSAAPASDIRGIVAAAGGHATLFAGADDATRAHGVFTPLAPPLLAIHRRLKTAFDPAGVFSPGRLYPEL